MSESKNVTAARRAVAKGASQVKDDRTPEKRLFDIGNHYASDLAVTWDDQKLLWAEYTGLVNQVGALKTENADLMEKNAEFREVYESENRSTSLTVERTLGEGADAAGQ